MQVLDIITLVVFLAALAVCVWKGFLKILLKLGALVIAAIIAKIFGKAVGDIWFSGLIKTSGEGMSAELLEKLNASIAVVIGTVVAFVIFYIVLRIIFHFVAKLVKKLAGVSTLDRILGAVFGIVVALGFMFVFSEAVRIVATIATYINPESTMFEVIESTAIFKYFI
jgi:uncharacterized membrane protein required for colicin V production